MKIFVGTSGYSYKEWKGHFYPEDLPASGMLRYYAERLNTVEINNTFYRLPSEKLLSAWAEQVPEEFSMVLKASRRITHGRQLLASGDTLSHLLQTAAVLGRRLGPMLFQFPPYFKKDAQVLKGFLELLPGKWRAAFEFRNASWFDDETYEILRAHGVALVTADTDGGSPAAIVPTADYGYLRLRREDYDAAALLGWAERVREQPWNEVHVFFKHEDQGAAPRMAAEFRGQTENCRS